MNVTNRGGYQGSRGRGRGHSRGRGGNFHTSNRDRNGEGSSSGIRGKAFPTRNKYRIQCHRCNWFGRYASKCQTKLQSQQGEQANAAKIEESLVLACKQGVDDTESSNIWYLDW